MKKLFLSAAVAAFLITTGSAQAHDHWHGHEGWHEHGWHEQGWHRGYGYRPYWGGRPVIVGGGYSPYAYSPYAYPAYPAPYYPPVAAPYYPAAPGLSLGFSLGR